MIIPKKIKYLCVLIYRIYMMMKKNKVDLN